MMPVTFITCMAPLARIELGEDKVQGAGLLLFFAGMDKRSQ